MSEESQDRYVCVVGDLDKSLSDPLKTKFQGLFEGRSAWRLHYGDLNPKEVLARYGIDLEHPTVRDAVAFDLVKLDNGSVSNDSVYTFSENRNYSSWELDRFLLNRNFRINLMHLEPEWSSITYTQGGTESSMQSSVVDSTTPGSVKVKRTVDRVYQGITFSDTMLSYFNSIFNASLSSDGSFDLEDIYVPFTNANDFQAQVAIIPNTHKNLRAVTSRAYYDMRHRLYKGKFRKFGISAISTFALVDESKDKNHIGWYLVKVQRKLGNGTYLYLVATIDKDGKFLMNVVNHDDGETVLVPDIKVFTSERNTILCVCASDFCGLEDGRFCDRKVVDGGKEWTPVERDIPMVKSTTSSHYSVFAQRIPDYDLKQVRHYLQFRTRLEGMELCLEQLKRDRNRKEVQSSECFTKETTALWRMVQAFSGKKELMEWVTKYYDLLAEWDDLSTRRVQLSAECQTKQEELDALLKEYNALTNRQMDQKLSLGQKIQSLKMEMDRKLKTNMEALDARRKEMVEEVSTINAAIDRIQSGEKEYPENMSEIEQKWMEVFNKSESSESELTKALVRIEDRVKARKERFVNDSTESRLVVMDAQQRHFIPDDPDGGKWRERGFWLDDSIPQDLPALTKIDTDELHHLVLMTEKWRGYMLNMGYELKQFKELETKCEDATIKVRRLVHNFEERMAQTEADVWDESHNLKTDFNFKGIATAGLRDIILLHDWYACNAPGKTFKEMGFNDNDEFMEFRRRCNRISYNLRKNQYAQMLAMEKDRLQDLVNTLTDRMEDGDRLKFPDKYGEEAKKDEEKEWSMADVIKEQADRISLLVSAEKVIKAQESAQRQYKADSKALTGRVVDYLKGLGAIESENDIQKLAIRNKAVNFQGDVNSELRMLENARQDLDAAKKNLQRQRDSMRSIIENVTKLDQKVVEMEARSKNIFQLCLTERNTQMRSRLLLERVQIEEKLMELRATSKKARGRNLKDFSKLEKLRKAVDEAQTRYDGKVRDFKEKVGLNQDAIDNLMIGIYNKYQDEILKTAKRNSK